MPRTCPRLLTYGAALLVACSSGGDGGSDDSQGGAGGSINVDNASGSGGGGAGDAGANAGTGGSGNAGGGASTASTTDDSLPDYGNPTIEPDTSTEKIDDCAGAPDMTLCDFVTMPDRWYDVCIDGACVSPGCGDETCNTPGAHFRIPPFEGHVYLEKQAGDQPVTIDKIWARGRTPHSTACSRPSHMASR